MGIINKMRRQTAVYWHPNGTDNFGRVAYDAPVELRVRWETGFQEESKTEPSRTTDARASVVYVPAIEGGDVAIGGWLWLGALEDAVDASNPENNPGAGQITKFDKIPTLKATEFLRKATLL